MNDAVRSMRAMRASSSDPASLTSETVPVPDPGPGELLVAVRATAITADELTWPESWPAIPCHDLSGVVAATGPGADGWRPGDEVYGLVGFDRPGAAPAKGGRDDVRSVFFVVSPDGGQLRELASLIDAGKLHPVVSTVFELNDLAEAFGAQRGSRPPGKVIINVSRSA